MTQTTGCIHATAHQIAFARDLVELCIYLNSLRSLVGFGEPLVDALREAGTGMDSLPTFGGDDASAERFWSWDDRRSCEVVLPA